MADDFRIGIAGVGDFSLKEHVPGIHGAGGKISAFCCRTEEVLKKKALEYKVPHTHRDYRDLVKNPDVDIVTITTPDATHEEIAVAALEAGKHVYLEKPPTTNSAEMERIALAAKKSGKYIYSGSHHLYRNNIQYMKKLVDDGFFGDIYAIDMLKLRRNNAPGDKRPGMHRGGVTLGSTSHRIDTILYLLGLPEVRSVTARTFDYFVRRRMMMEGKNEVTGLVEDTVIANIQFANGCVATIRDIHGAHMEQPEDAYCWFGDFSIFGSEAGAKLHPLTIFQNQSDGSMTVTVPDVNNDLRAGHTPVYTYFFECIRNGTAPEKSPDRAVTLMKIIDAIYDSAAAGGKQIEF